MARTSTDFDNVERGPWLLWRRRLPLAPLHSMPDHEPCKRLCIERLWRAGWRAGNGVRVMGAWSGWELWGLACTTVKARAHATPLFLLSIGPSFVPSSSVP